eukprot:scaffold1747_cov251-Pinguiococcus_pyrenoidosus.AAC.11
MKGSGARFDSTCGTPSSEPSASSLTPSTRSARQPRSPRRSASRRCWKLARSTKASFGGAVLEFGKSEKVPRASRPSTSCTHVQ